MDEGGTEQGGLQRHFGLLQATALNVTMIVGAGVFATIPHMLGKLPGPYALLGWLAAVTLQSATAPACTATAPCGPDLVRAVGGVALFGAPVLLWWMPTAGLVAGAAFAVLDTLIDPVTASRAGWRSRRSSRRSRPTAWTSSTWPSSTSPTRPR